jgi:hypothetical protein
MQKEIEIQQYVAAFSKTRREGCLAYDYVRIAKTSDYGYSIIKGHNYGTEGMPDDWADETITCEYPATVEWIYAKCRSICNSCNSGKIITDIPFESE